jgi:hypothetical protein
MTTSPFTLLLAEKHFARGCKCRKLRAGSNIVTLLFPIYDFYLVLKSKIKKNKICTQTAAQKMGFVWPFYSIFYRLECA